MCQRTEVYTKPCNSR